MPKRIITAIAAVVLSVIGATLTASVYHENVVRGQAATPLAKPGEPLRKVIRKKGWRVPGRDEFKTVERVQNISFAGVAVTRKTLRTSAEPLVEAEGYSLGSDGQLLISEVLCEVRDVFSYELNGRIFAYETRLQLVRVDMQGRRERTGAMFNLWYYDDDGSGRFESPIGATELQKIPEWVKGWPAK